MSEQPIKTNKLLLVEGKDEVNLFTALLKWLNIDKVDVRSAGGCRKFSKLYPAVAVTTGFSFVKKIGFVRDAEDNSANSAFMSISHIIKQYTPHIALPASPGIITNAIISCGVFIMPNNKDAGMLEDLCLKSVVETQLYAETEKFVNSAKFLLSENDTTTYNIKMQAYLAGTTDIPRSLGEAALQGLWNFSLPAFDEIKDFLINLFS